MINVTPFWPRRIDLDPFAVLTVRSSKNTKMPKTCLHRILIIDLFDLFIQPSADARSADFFNRV